MNIESFLKLLDKVKSSGNGYTACCPAHEDHSPSLSISEGNDGRVLLKCFAECKSEAIVSALGLAFSDLFPPKEAQPLSARNNHKNSTPRQIATTYDYQDEQGKILFQAVRYLPKGFSQRRPDEKGGWIWNLNGVRRVIYRLPELLVADPSATVFVCEGEKDADRLRELGLIATTNPQGAGKWREDYSHFLKGHEVVILPDNDDAGRNHAQAVAHSLYGVAASVKVLELPGLLEKGDVSDWLNADGQVKRLCAMVEDAANWKPTDGTQPSEQFESNSLVLSERTTNGSETAEGAAPKPSSEPIREILFDGQLTLELTPSNAGKAVLVARNCTKVLHRDEVSLNKNLDRAKFIKALGLTEEDQAKAHQTLLALADRLDQLKSEYHEAGDSGSTISQHLFRLVEKNAELFHDAGGDCFASVTINDHRETYKLGSRDFKDWLAGLLYRETDKGVSGDKINEAVTVLRAKARYESPKVETHVRVAEHTGEIYLDLCNEAWQQVEITESGWHVIESKDSPIRFRRAGGMLALPVPVRGGELCELRELLNLPATDRDNWPLLLGELVAALKPCNETRFAYPLLAIHGEQGSAKSTATRLLRRLIDPNKADLRVTPKDERDLAIAAEHGRVLAFDNLTYLSDSLSNALCRMATGGGFATRELFTDEGEVIFDSQRPVFLNGIAEVVAKSDLLDRAILIYLPQIPKKRRRLDRVIDREFAVAQPRVLGCLLDAVSIGLRRMRAGIHLEELPRMADFAEWVVACEPGLGLAEGQFLQAYQRNQEKANGLAIEASPVAQAIVAMIADCRAWTGTTGGLLKVLNGRIEVLGENPKFKQGWPQTPRALGAKVKEIAPNLRRSNVEVSFGERGRNGYTIMLSIRTGEESADNVHNVHHVHEPTEINEIKCEHRDEHCDGEVIEIFTQSELAPFCEDQTVISNTDAPANVHAVNDWKQIASELREHCEHLSGTTESAPRRRVSI